MKHQRQRVLAGDIGGTHARLALFQVTAEKPVLVTETVFSSAEYDGLEPIVQEFLREIGETPDRGCLGIACPVEGAVCHAPNLEWDVYPEGFGESVGIKRLEIINDFEAAGYGVPVLTGGDLEILQEGAPRNKGPIGLIGAGTGLGQGYLLWEQGTYAVHGSEGGHADFAAVDSTQWEFLLYLQARHGHVSWERVVSGPGLVDAYEFLRDGREVPEGDRVRLEMQKEGTDAAGVISHHALAETDPLSEAAMEIFIRAFGAQAGNLALTLRATGGIFIAGGIAPKVLPKLRRGPFLEAFRSKGRLTEFMERIPVRVIVNDSVGLLGAAVVASRL